MDLSEVWHLAQSAGPFATAIMMYLYFDERKERRKKDRELNDVLQRSIAVIDEVRSTMATWLSIFERVRP